MSSVLKQRSVRVHFLQPGRRQLFQKDQHLWLVSGLLRMQKRFEVDASVAKRTARNCADDCHYLSMLVLQGVHILVTQLFYLRRN